MQAQSPSFRTVPAGRGWDWIKEGTAMFVRQPGIWLGVSLLTLVLVGIVSRMGILAVATPVVVVLLYGGLMIGCAAQGRGGELEIEHLFAGFKRPVQALLILGVVLMVARLATGWIAGVLGAVFGLGSMVSSFAAAASGDPYALSAALAGAGIMALIWLMVVLTLVTGVTLAFMFSPGLVALGGVAPQAAIQASFLAAWRNWRALTVYGLAGVVLLFLSIITVIGIFVIVPVSITTAYLAYRDVFADVPDMDGAPTEEL